MFFAYKYNWVFEHYKKTTAVNKFNKINFSNNSDFSPRLMVIPSALGDTDSNSAGDANFLL